MKQLEALVEMSAWTTLGSEPLRVRGFQVLPVALRAMAEEHPYAEERPGRPVS